MPLAADEVLLNHCRQAKTFLEAHSHCTNTYIAVSRPGAADETTANGTDKSVTYKVRSKTQQRTTGLRSSYGFYQCFDTGIPEI